ncbi:MAG: PqqD family protein [Acidobacteria bacterium]|nr:PqqD family protein [Acidobacteriota bacterium]MYJ03239.1 PqqD family protein [Acidobacteriota bacterium]
MARSATVREQRAGWRAGLHPALLHADPDAAERDARRRKVSPIPPRPAQDLETRAGAQASGASPSDAAGAVSADAIAFWSSRPRRCLGWRELDDGRCVVLRPQFGEGTIGRWLASKLGDPCYRIRLDDVGTFIWKACDGETPLTEIAGRLRRAFGERVEPAEERLARFVRSMLRSRMIDV